MNLWLCSNSFYELESVLCELSRELGIYKEKSAERGKHGEDQIGLFKVSFLMVLKQRKIPCHSDSSKPGAILVVAGYLLDLEHQPISKFSLIR